VNADIRMALQDAERALHIGDPSFALQSFITAGDVAVTYQLWRSAARSYRLALELDLAAEPTIAKLVALGAKLPTTAPDWTDYAVALRRRPWPHFGCRGAQISIADRGAYVDCPPVGRVLELAMTANDHVEVVPDPRHPEMPLAMALVILRRAFWAQPREEGATQRIHVTFLDRSQWLDELGEWGPGDGSRSTDRNRRVTAR
jgi:hypothetical protein